MIAVGLFDNELTTAFADCDVVARIDNGIGLRSKEQGDPIAVCRGLRGSWAELWPRLRYLG